ncbi:hypothetical protein ACTXOF_02305 [Glutamicibacter arilaitensis]
MNRRPATKVRSIKKPSLEERVLFDAHSIDRGVISNDASTSSGFFGLRP